VAFVVTIVLDFTLIPAYGFRGAAIASSIAYTFAMAVDLVWVLRNSSISAGRLLVPRPDDAKLLLATVRQAGWLGMVGLERR
jgi:Na+-driven multidrug efflux pump